MTEEGKIDGLVSVRNPLIPLYPNMGDYIHDSVGGRDFVGMEDGFGKSADQNGPRGYGYKQLTVSPDDPILKAAHYRDLKNFRRIPVEENGNPV